jgi:hypothetical protein
MSQITDFAESMDAGILGKIAKPEKPQKNFRLLLESISLLDRHGNEVKCGDYVYLHNNINRLFRIEGVLQSAGCFLLWNHTRYYPREITKVKVKF